jgi:hypothetical protein
VYSRQVAADKDKCDVQSARIADQETQPKRKVLPTTKWCRPSSVPEVTGFRISGVTSRRPKKADEIRRYLMSGAEALKAENIIKLFEALKDRKAISDEIANVERKLKEK